MRRQQQAGLRPRNAFDQADRIEGGAETGQAVGVEFDDHVPTTMGPMRRLDLRESAQRLEHGARARGQFAAVLVG